VAEAGVEPHGLSVVNVLFRNDLRVSGGFRVDSSTGVKPAGQTVEIPHFVLGGIVRTSGRIPVIPVE
jgi:hypothetical protein